MFTGVLLLLSRPILRVERVITAFKLYHIVFLLRQHGRIGLVIPKRRQVVSRSGCGASNSLEMLETVNHATMGLETVGLNTPHRIGMSVY